MKYIEYLYYRYYKFQVRMGNRNIAPFSSMLIISFIFMLYYFSIFFWVILFIARGALDMKIFMYLSFFIFIILIIWLYQLLIYKGKYKELIKRCDKEYQGKGNLGALLFPLIAFLLFSIGWLLKMMQNQGRL